MSDASSIVGVSFCLSAFRFWCFLAQDHLLLPPRCHVVFFGFQFQETIIVSSSSLLSLQSFPSIHYTVVAVAADREEATQIMSPREPPHHQDPGGDADDANSILLPEMRYLSSWDEGDTSSPLVDRSNRPLHISDHSSSTTSRTTRESSPPTSPTKAYPYFSATLVGTSNNRSLTSPQKKQQQVIGGEYELKNARDALVGSISAIINFLLISGVPKPACDQLQKNLDLNRYFATMTRIQEYVQCLPCTDEDTIMAKIHLTVTPWEALCRLKTIEYQRAYKWSAYVRLFQAQATTTSSTTSTECQAAIALQVKRAEQCSACQKKLYIVHKWKKHWLTKLRRSTTIQPKGYQPIRCL